MKHGLTLFLASWLVVLPAAAQAPAPETVYSEAQRARDETLSRRYVEAALQPSMSLAGQYARWVKPMCVQVGGLADAAGRAVERRIREVAAKVGAPVDASDTCGSNVIILVNGDPLKTLDLMAARKLVQFMDGDRNGIKVRFPIQAFYMGLFIDSRGRPHLDTPMIDTLYGDRNTVYNQTPQMIASDDSRLQHGIQPQLGTVTIIVDAHAIGGMSLGALADYLALMALAQTPASGHCLPAPTIANLFVPDCDKDLHATALSVADMSMHKALYETPLEPANLQQTRIVGAMRKGLEAQFGK